MARAPREEELGERSLLRIGHKGADAIAPGNTLASFNAAAQTGVELIELDVLRPPEDFERVDDWRNASAGPAQSGGPLLIAHDWADAKRREPLTLAQGLDAFTRPPLDGVEIDFDIKVPGREDELLAALGERDLLARARVSTMEVSTLRWLRSEEPGLRLGWTVPRLRRDWSSVPWFKPMLPAGLGLLRARLPGIVRRGAPKLGVHAVWALHHGVSARLVRAAHDVGCQIYCWTVDDAPRMRELAALGVDGICTNDPRLFAELD